MAENRCKASYGKGWIPNLLLAVTVKAQPLVDMWYPSILWKKLLNWEGKFFRSAVRGKQTVVQVEDTMSMYHVVIFSMMA